MSKELEPSALDYFVGGVPAGPALDTHLTHLRKIVEHEDVTVTTSTLPEVCFIALIAYFEAFCKDHFASLVNVCPQLLDRLKEQGASVDVDASLVVKLPGDARTMMGFLVAERLDFGTPQRVSSLYSRLLKISPFSERERREYDRLLNDRNLLVHHGGVFTVRYAEQEFVKRQMEGRIWMDSLVISKEGFLAASQFLESIARKTVTATHSRLTAFMEQRHLIRSGEHDKAVEFVGSWF